MVINKETKWKILGWLVWLLVAYIFILGIYNFRTTGKISFPSIEIKVLVAFVFALFLILYIKLDKLYSEIIIIKERLSRGKK